jgi:hypothetical protein
VKLKLIVGAVCFLVAVGLTYWQRQQPPPELKGYKGLAGIKREDSFERKIQGFAEQAMLDAWNRCHIRLRLDAGSLRDCDEYLGRVGSSSWFKNCSEKDQRAEAIIAGAFVGEAIRRTHGGEWMESTDVPDAGGYGLKVYGEISFPVTWCHKRLVNGREDNIFDKYRYFILQQTNGSFDVTVYTNKRSGSSTLTNSTTP